MNPLAFLSPYRWLVSFGLLVALIGGAWTWHTFKVHEAVTVQKQADASVLTDTINRINAAATQAQAQAQVESAQRAQTAQERIHELQIAQETVSNRAAVLARQLRELRAAESQRGIGLSSTPSPGQEPRSNDLSGLSSPLSDRIDQETLNRLTLAEKLRQSCIKLWEQANNDRK